MLLLIVLPVMLPDALYVMVNLRVKSANVAGLEDISAPSPILHRVLTGPRVGLVGSAVATPSGPPLLTPRRGAIGTWKIF
jgi:hypothetical protein